VLEEAPALRVPRELLSDLGERCVQACHAIDYHGAGTFEFLHQDGRFHFIEMNTRLQVEHTLTEMVTGIDIVEQQIRIARGEALAFTQRDVIESGHAIECRINAEDPETCLPSPGRVTHWVTPGGPGVRVDSHMQAGQTVSPHYDSLMAKLVTHGSTRQQALARMRVALAEMQVVGLQTNIPLHRRLMDDPALLSGPVDNRHLERLLNAGHAR
jgi:acetyl-CoA carboxylase biotin carboxylase subunit